MNPDTDALAADSDPPRPTGPVSPPPPLPGRVEGYSVRPEPPATSSSSSTSPTTTTTPPPKPSVKRR